MTNIDIFTDLADKYGNSINTTKEAEVFFDEFMAMTGGMVIFDFLDCDNDDHIEKNPPCHLTHIAFLFAFAV